MLGADGIARRPVVMKLQKIKPLRDAVVTRSVLIVAPDGRACENAHPGFVVYAKLLADFISDLCKPAGVSPVIAPITNRGFVRRFKKLVCRRQNIRGRKNGSR